MIKKILCISAFYLLFNMCLSAQDAHFSQSHLTHQMINPAMNGLFAGQYRVGLHYRDQFSSIVGIESYKTMYAQVDSKVHITGNDFFTWGVDIIRDAAGVGKLNQIQGNLSIGLIKQVTKYKYGGIGESYMMISFKAGVGQNSLDWSKFWFGRQFDVSGGIVNPNLPSGETIVDSNGKTTLYPDFSTGLMWYTVWSERRSLYIGAAGFHLNSPNIGLSDDSDDNLYTRFSLHAGGEVDFSKQFSILPKLIFYLQGPSVMIIPGVQLRYQHNDWREVALRFGVASRVARTYQGYSNESIIFNSTFEYKHLLFGLSYDFSTSKILATNGGRGAMEFGIQYRNPDTKFRTPIKCPRY